MHLLLPLLLLAALLYAPSFWVRRVMERHRSGKRFPFTGGELAERLVEGLQLEGVEVETTEGGDHYDPLERRVRLHPDNHAGHDLTAITIAAHEVGHAIQHARGERPFLLRQRLATWSMMAQRFGGYALLAVPVLALIARHPTPPLILFLLSFATIASAALVHLVTLPVELDASFNKALPLLREGEVLDTENEEAVSRILRAAAWTYAASSLAGLFSVWRWLRLLRR